jgi:hypothetical protein
MVVVPEPVAVTSPVDGSTVAIEVFALLHVPPGVVTVRGDEPPTQLPMYPEMAEGVVLTVKLAVAGVQPTVT